MTGKFPPILTNAEQYRCELYRIERLTPEEEEDLWVKAHNHDQEARARLIADCLRYVMYMAWRYQPYAKASDDFLDIVGVGNLALVETFDKALTKRHPKAFLLGVAKWTMRSYCRFYASLIPYRSRTEGAVSYSSLDQPIRSGRTLGEALAANGQQRAQPAAQDYEDLYQAIAQLDEKHRHIILRHYGLDGDAPEPLAHLSKQLSTNPKQTIAHLRHMRALKQLRSLLTILREKTA